jgi:hypothetical protein
MILNSNQFFLIFISTITVIRIFLFLKPIPAPTIKEFRIHHWMYGLTGIPISILLGSVVLYAISLGLFVDELTYLVIRGKNHEDNYSEISILGTVVFVIIAFLFRDYLISFV